MSIAMANFDDGKGPLDPDAMIAQGWVYRDIPTWFSTQMWEQFRTVMGDENHRIMAFTKATDTDGSDLWRGQFLISPAGMLALASWSGPRQ